MYMYLEVYTPEELAAMTDIDLDDITEEAEREQSSHMRSIDRWTKEALRIVSPIADAATGIVDPHDIDQVKAALDNIMENLAGYDQQCARISDTNEERRRRAR